MVLRSRSEAWSMETPQLEAYKRKLDQIEEQEHEELDQINEEEEQ